MTKLGHVKNGLMINMVPTNKKLKERMMRIKKFNDKKQFKITPLIMAEDQVETLATFKKKLSKAI